MADSNTIITADVVAQWSEEEKDKARRLCKTELFFLANNVLRTKGKKILPLLRSVHGNISANLIPTNPDLPFDEWSPIKEWVVMSPRGTLKSVIEAAFIVQIILCFPNVRILVLSGKLSQATSIMNMVRGYFMGNDVLRLLFPEFCDGIKVNAEEFMSPARQGVVLRDPTISIATFDSVKAGWHGEFVLLDDCTNEINCATPEMVVKTIDKYDDLDPLMEPGGYRVFTGTRWGLEDLPEIIRERGEKLEKETGKKYVNYFMQPVWKVKPAANPLEQIARDDREKHGRLEPNDVELLWPEKLTAEFLWPKYRANRRNFACQYLLNPESVISGVFTRGLLMKQTRPITEQPPPHLSDVFINWDLSGISGKGDWAVGIVGFWGHDGRLFIIDCVMEKFRSSTEIATSIVLLFKKWAPVAKYRIEEANGARLLEGEITRIAIEAKLQHPFYIHWVVPEKDKDAKIIRIRELASALDNDMIRFWDGLPNLQELYAQFEKFTGKGKYKDDGPDCLAQLYREYKGQIRGMAVKYLMPNGQPTDWEPDPFVDRWKKKNETIDSHADEKANADIDWLNSFTVPHATN